MKKVLWFVVGFIILLVLAGVLVPVIFKDDIKAQIDKAIAENVDAKVYYDADQLNLSVFSHFPNVTLSMGDFGIVGNEPFAGDTLMAANTMDVVVDIMSVISGEQIEVVEFALDKAFIQVITLEDGRANYDIAKSTGKEEETPEEESDVSVKINHWKLSDSRIIYDDRSSQMYVNLQEINHNGSGDFAEQVFDMDTETSIASLYVRQEGTELLTHKSLDADITMRMNLDSMKFTFKENEVKVNEFTFGFDGFFAMPGDEYQMDIAFHALENSFKSLLSLVPVSYMEGYEDMEAQGDIAFEGFLKGIYSEAKKTMPAYQVKIKVADGKFKFPDVPEPVSNVNVDMLVDNNTGDMKDLLLEIRKFHADLGNNPVDAKLLVTGWGSFEVNGNVDAEINLEELSQMFPMEGLTMKGDYKIHAKANGTYDTVRSLIPKIDANMSLKEGYVKSSDFPVPIEHIFVIAKVVNKTGKMENTLVDVNDFEFELEKEKMKGNLHLENLNDYTWNANLKGNVDLEKMMKIYPIDSTMTMTGKIYADINTKGKMSDLDAERYDKLPTRGDLVIKDFSFYSPDLPQGFKISQATANFDPQRINLKDFSGYIGKSDMKLTGYLSNYLAYALKDNAIIKGQMNFTSGQFDLNEWMTEEEEAPKEEEKAEEGVIEVPRNVDFVLNARIGKVLYEDLTLNNMKGQIIIKDGVMTLKNGRYSMLGSNFVLAGYYDTRDLQHPKFDFDFKIDAMEIKKAYSSFDVVQKFAPVAGRMDGSFSTTFDLAGELGKDMTPNWNTLYGQGLINVLNASLQSSNILKGVASVTKLGDADEIKLDDVKVDATIKKGRVYVKPFDVKMGGYKTTIAGNQGVDGSLDYVFKMDVPAGELGTQVNSFISGLFGKEVSKENTNLLLDLGVTGTYEDPKVKVLGTKMSTSGTSSKSKTKTEVEKKDTTEEVQENVEKEVEDLKKKAKKKLKNIFGGD